MEKGEGERDEQRKNGRKMERERVREGERARSGKNERIEWKRRKKEGDMGIRKEK